MTIGGSNLHLRTTPFYATRCTGCGLEIMTNRDQGKGIRCKRCGAEHSAHPIRTPAAEELAIKLMDSAPMASDGREVEYLGLALQLPTSEMHSKFVAICTEQGFRRLGERSFLLSKLISDVQKSGTFDMNLPILGFISETPHPAAIAGNAMPPVIDRLVRRLRTEFRGIRTASRGVHPNDPVYRFDIYPQELPRRIEELIKTVSEVQFPDEISLAELIELLRICGRLKEAVPFARRLATARPGDPRYQSTLGAIELQFGNLDAAITALEATLKLDPSDTAHMYMLGLAYQRSGDQLSAQKWFSRSAALGGPMGPV